METMQAVHKAHHAVVHEVGGKSLPVGYGDFDAEVAALDQGAGLVDLEACGVIGIRGPDAALFLNGVVTNNVKALAKGIPQGNLLCGNKGKILHALTVLRIKDEEFLAITEPGELDAVAAHLDAYHVREELQMGVAGLTRLDLIGPRAEDVLHKAGIDASQIVQPFGGSAVVGAAFPLGRHPRRLLLVPAAHASRLAETLLAAGAGLAGYDALDECRIWAGVPRFGQDFTTDFLPAEAAVYTHIAFDKGCYVGQEIHARQHYRGHANRKLVGVRFPADRAQGLAVGAELFAGAEIAGRLTSLSRSAHAGTGSLERAGIAILRFDAATRLEPLSFQAGEPPEVTLHPLATDLGVARS